MSQNKVKSSNIAKKSPTKKQAEILKFIIDYKLKHSCSPTFKELARYFKTSEQAASKNIRLMAKKNLVTIEKGKHRSIAIPEEENRYCLVKNNRGLLVFKYYDLELPITDFEGKHFKVIE